MALTHSRAEHDSECGPDSDCRAVDCADPDCGFVTYSKPDAKFDHVVFPFPVVTCPNCDAAFAYACNHPLTVTHGDPHRLSF